MCASAGVRRRQCQRGGDSVKPEDFEGQPCACKDCRAANMETRPIIRDRFSGKWLHGNDLRRWYAAKDRFWSALKVLAEEKDLTR